MQIPENLKYTSDHEWLLLEGEVATVGVTDFAQSELGDIVYVDITKVGETLKAGEVFGLGQRIGPRLGCRSKSPDRTGDSR